MSSYFKILWYRTYDLSELNKTTVYCAVYHSQTWFVRHWKAHGSMNTPAILVRPVIYEGDPVAGHLGE